MQIFLVGGAVRDQLLELPIVDKDFLVVGSSPEEMLAQGFHEVGKGFPVFLHPKTGEEYALARTESKAGHGYKGFNVDFSPSITIEQDLLRRDLTINAIAQADDGTLIDPYHGQQDIERKILRHVSPAFAEDPLRVLRVARFASRFAHLGFTIAPETLALMQQLTDDGELEHLTPERVWQETEKALNTQSPSVYFEALRACGALKVLIPELDCLWGVPNPEQWHPEIDSGIHTMMVLDQATQRSKNPVVRFAAVMHDLGKGVTPSEQWPHHRGHEESGVKVIKALCKRLKVPKAYEQLACHVSRFHLHCHKMFELRAKTVHKVLKGLGAYRNKDVLQQFLISCESDATGRLGLETEPYPQAQLLWQCFENSKQVDVQELIDRGYEKSALGQAIDQAQIKAIQETLDASDERRVFREK